MDKIVNRFLDDAPPSTQESGKFKARSQLVQIYCFEVEEGRVRMGREVDSRMPGIEKPSLQQYLNHVRGAVEVFNHPFLFGKKSEGNTTVYYVDGTSLGWASRSVETLLLAGS